MDSKIDFFDKDFNSTTEVEEVVEIHIWKFAGDLSEFAKYVNLETLKIGLERVNTGFGAFPKLTSLTFYNTNFSEDNLIEISTITTLKTLDLGTAEIADFSHIAKLPNLKSLECRFDANANVHVLAVLTSLKHLTINQVIDAPTLESMTSLKSLKIKDGEVLYNILRNVPPERLEILKIFYPTPEAIELISSFTNLKELSIIANSYNDTIDLVFLRYLVGLEKLVIGGTTVKNEWNLARLINLQSLEISDVNSAISSGILCPLINLEHLKLNNVMYFTSIDLSTLRKLKSLDLINLKITDISSISELTSLETLSLVQTNVKDISCISKLVNLQDVRLDHSPISNITPLYSLTKLVSLNLTRTHVKDVSVLTYLPLIEEVWLPDLIKGGFPAIYKVKRVYSMDEVSVYTLTDDNEIKTVNVGPFGRQTIGAQYADKSITGDNFKMLIGGVKGLVDESTGLTSKSCRT